MGEQNKSRLQRICSISKYLVLACVVIIVLSLVGTLGLMAMMLADSSFVPNGMTRDDFWFYSVLTIFNLVTNVFLFYVLYLFTKSVGDNNSPFTSGNVRLLKMMAAILLTGWVVALVVILVLSSVLSVTIPGINGDALLMAGIVYVISLVFEYGVRLQEDSDSIV